MGHLAVACPSSAPLRPNQATCQSSSPRRFVIKPDEISTAIGLSPRSFGRCYELATMESSPCGQPATIYHLPWYPLNRNITALSFLLISVQLSGSCQCLRLWRDQIYSQRSRAGLRDPEAVFLPLFISLKHLVLMNPACPDFGCMLSW
jgi:hypothetical protein